MNTDNFIPQIFSPIPFSNSHAISINSNHFVSETSHDPCGIGYIENHGKSDPITFCDLAKCKFSTKEKVKIAMQHISVIEKKSVHIIRSEARRITFKCIPLCNFTMTWNENNGIWTVSKNSICAHNCTFETAKIPKLHSTVIDSYIDSLSLSCSDFESGLTILDHFVGKKADRRSLRQRLKLMDATKQINDFWWQTIQSYLKNNILNGGLSDMYLTNNNEIHSFAMVPQYSVLLLRSKAILPVLIIDGTFQSSVHRGTMIIVMAVSSNRTNIPLGWSWGPTECEDCIKLILELIKKVNDKIETIISDMGSALKAAISEVFPNAVHKFCAWHISKSISNQDVKKIFWLLLRADHPIIFQNLLHHLLTIGGDLSKVMSNKRLGIFSRFFEGAKENDIITSSP